MLLGELKKKKKLYKMPPLKIQTESFDLTCSVHDEIHNLFEKINRQVY